ncbi:MAG: HD domain-containing phosphohydrolase [bacterium]
MEKIHLREAVPGMILARPVTILSASGRELIQRGVMLEKGHIRKLQQWGIEFVFIETIDDGYSVSVPFSESIRMLARQTYEDAISSLTRICSSVLEGQSCEIGVITQSVTRILEVVSMESSILSLLSRIRTSDEYLYRHSVDVCVIATVVGKKAGVGAEKLKSLGIASLLHDLGMMRYKKDSWDNCMLTAKPGRIKRHPELSREIVSSIEGISRDVLDAVLMHHELHDGSGYPRGAAGGEIPETAAVLAIAEAYCTLTAPYGGQNALEPHRALPLIIKSPPDLFHPKVRRAFIGTVSLFPPGTFILLSNELRGVVISGNKDNPLRPRVLVLFDGERPIKPYHLDLADYRNKGTFIERPISPLTDLARLEEILKA